MDRLSSEQSRILDGFRRFHARAGRLPSSTEAQASVAGRPPEIVPYREVMAAFPGRTWREVRVLMVSHLGLDHGAVTRRDAAISPASSRARKNAESCKPVRDSPLSDAQFGLLWEVCRVPRLVDELDGRTLRALVARGLARVEGEWLSGTDRARPAVRQHLQALVTASSSGRVTALYRALLVLEEALPNGAEVSIGRAIVSVDDVALGFYRKARVVRRRAGPSGQ